MARSDDAETRAARWEKEAHDLSTQVAFLQEELALVRRKLTESPRHVRQLEERLAATQAQLARLTENNERLVATLKEARGQIVTLKEEIDRLAQPPSGYGVFLTASRGRHGRHLHRRPQAAGRGLPVDRRRGARSGARRSCSTTRSTSSTRSVTSAPARSSCSRRSSRAATGRWSSRTPTRSASCTSPTRSMDAPLRTGDSLMIEPRSAYAYERIPKSEVEELVLEEVPDVDYHDIGGLDRQIELIRDAVELPFLHADLFREHQLRPPKGILLYGPPGCGKTLIAKAVANSLAKKIAERRGEEKHTSYFLNIKGPELLNKYVGETERHIRLIFQRAREKASEGTPVIVFFDEMDSIFRTRGSGVSSDVENTIVPQLLSRDRRRRGPGERDRDRRVQPGRHDRPGDPAPGPTRREDQDRASGRRGGEGHLPQVHPDRPAAARRRPGRARRRRRRLRGGDDPGDRAADVLRDRREPVPRGHLRQR